jgi:hypothetical protein
MNTLNNYHVVKNVSAYFLFFLGIRSLHLISKLVWSNFEELCNTRYFFSKLLEFPVNFNLEVNLTSCQALIIIIEREQSIVALHLEELLIIIVVLIWINFKGFIVITEFLFLSIHSISYELALRVDSLCFLIRLSIFVFLN